MTEKEIKSFQDKLFLFLLDKHNQDTNIRFRVRQRNIDRLSKGYWFGGNESYLETSFWDGSDYLHKTPQIRLVFDYYTFEWFLELVARDSTDRASYFRKLAEHIGGFELGKYPDILQKKLQGIGNTNNWLETLEHFIDTTKQEIDNYKKEYPFVTKNKKKPIIDIEDEELELEDSSAFSLESFQKNIAYIELWRSNLGEDNRLNVLVQAKEIKRDFAISRLSISNFQGIDNLLVENIPLDAQWIFLTGNNGFGKTSVLRAIAKGLVGDEDFVSPLDNNAKIFVNAIAYKKTFKHFARMKVKPIVNIPLAAYGVSRFQSLPLGQEEFERSKQSTYSLFHDNGQLMNIEKMLINAERDDKHLFKKLKDIITSIIPAIADIQSKKENKERKIRYYEKDDANKAFKPVLINELAAGYKSILNMVGDMIMRLSNDGQSKLDSLAGIVLIDEIDAHLHPQYQYELPNLLSKVFPKIQFIATTHSPIPLLGLPEDNRPVIFKVNRTVEEGITIDRLDDDFDIRQLNPEALLTSPIFGFQTLFARGAKAKDIIPTSEFQDVVDIQNIKKRLEKLREQGLVK
ncbi:MAG: AAA family ATPase [Saprospiraceae bacterium]|nr:AAA family ATPase [Saprospiraceae bacterium]